MAVDQAVAFLHDEPINGARGDYVMSLVVLRALSGTDRAASVLAHALAGLAHRHADAAVLVRLSEAWADETKVGHGGGVSP